LVQLDGEINQTLTLPNNSDFFLPGFLLVGWSFFEGDYEGQIADEEAYNAAHPTNTAERMQPSLKVAADNLVLNDKNNDSNTLYAMWNPKVYTITVRQVVETGVPVTTQNYSYRIGEETELTAYGSTLTLNGNASQAMSYLTTDPAQTVQYYDRVGHAIRIKTPTITSSEYSVTVSVYVTRDDGTRGQLDPAPGTEDVYRVMGDLEITYTYALNTDVKLQKRDMTNKDTVVNGAEFLLTPMQFNNATRRWERINGAPTHTYSLTSGEATKKLQEGTYLVEETQAPTGYSALGINLMLTVRKNADFILRTESGGLVDDDIAELVAGTGGYKNILRIYDRPLREVVIRKVVVGDDSEKNGYNFDVGLKLDGVNLKNFDTGGNGNAADTTNSSGYLDFKVKNGESRTLKVPYGADIVITEGYYAYYSVATAGTNCTDGTTTDEDNRIFSFQIDQNATVTYTNTRKSVDVRFRKVDGFGNRLNGAEFTVYTSAACADGDKLLVLGNAVTDTSQARNGSQGEVLLEKIPSGVYYLKETGTVTDANGVTWENSNTYVLVVGQKALDKEDGLNAAAAACLSDISPATANAQASLYANTYSNEYNKYAIFLIDSSTGKAVTTPDIARYGVMNIADIARKAILKKVDSTKTPLSGKVFDLLRWDRTVMDVNLPSVSDGVFWIGTLPYGTYYVHEKDPDVWFRITVSADGVECVRLNAPPAAP